MCAKHAVEYTETLLEERGKADAEKVHQIVQMAGTDKTGKNFVNYLKELRVNEAKRLLEETDLRVIEISQKVGYENEKHFMKLFKS